MTPAKGRKVLVMDDTAVDRLEKLDELYDAACKVLAASLDEKSLIPARENEQLALQIIDRWLEVNNR